MGFSKRVQVAVLGAVVVTVAVAGTVYAAGAGGTISVCVHKKGGALYQARRCAKHDSKLTWNLQGPPGKQGKQGKQGIQGNQGVPGQPGPSAGYTAYHDAAVAVSTTTFTQIGSLDVPAGAYVAFAKLWASNTGGAAAPVSCELIGGGDFDVTRATLDPSGSAGAVESLALTVGHNFASAGKLTVSCSIASATVDFSNIKIAAIKVGSVTNTGF